MSQYYGWITIRIIPYMYTTAIDSIEALGINVYIALLQAWKLTALASFENLGGVNEDCHFKAAVLLNGYTFWKLIMVGVYSYMSTNHIRLQLMF